ncbi:DNA/RNA non-specific endonuclease [Streptomyces sp. NPDC096079]|uniref:DNA/RNA non-specific endonuclease n=1 Tax=unclassified Streptomyces TaxID=2593676 RepID=UPI00332CFE29
MTPSDVPPPPGRPTPAERRAAALAGRTGYDEAFLGPVVPLALPVRHTVGTVILPYARFTVVFRPDRRLAASAAVCVEGREPRLDTPGEHGWAYDPRLPEEHQAGDEVYRNNSLDRGALVRRPDVAWGAPAVAASADADTFHYPNAAPRADVFNRDRELWEGLENHLLDHAAPYDRRLAVLTGPVLQDSDPPYRGLQVPLRFWKVAAFLQDGALAAAAYVLDQSPDLSRDAERALAGTPSGAPPPLGPFRVYQVPVADVAEITELEFGPLPDVDVMPPYGEPEERWRRLEAYEDVVLHP